MAKENQENLRLMTSEFRASFPHLFKPNGMAGSTKLSYSIEMLFDKSTTDLKAMQAPLFAAAVAKWGPDKTKWPTPLSLPIRDGDKPHGKKKEVRPEHAGKWVVKASSNAEYSKPHVVGPNPKIALENESEFYPGCYARASLKAFAYTFADKDGVKFLLDAVQKTRDGEAMGGKKPADQIFGIIESESFEDQNEADDQGFGF